ncbi:copper resistance protein CopZ [Streptomyces carminius]|uniref:Copper resistance protein CopZ n=1 Tax=Streptomyces carminius TaxID=2665496 RepID=A0A2M8LX16_9ACTN|nr:copper chaperone PCu(A)C [Streptomyces carminius]PJE96507.1 copper resistance protein CopZ [Streptomyces carminius]
MTRPRTPGAPGTRRARRGAALLAAALLAAGTTACGSGTETQETGTGTGAETAGPELTVEGAYMPEPVTTDTAGGFLVVHNSGGSDDALTSATSAIANEVQIHRTDGGRMERVASLPVPADGALELSRGGNHLMFMDLDRRPEKGEKVTVELRFEKSDPIEIEIPVEATNHVPTHSPHTHEQ